MEKTTQIDRFCPVGIGGTKNLDTTHLKLFIGNLPESCGSQQLYDALISYGPIREAVVIPDRFRVRSRRYGFVTFVDPQSANRVLNSQPYQIADRTLTIVLACTNAKPRRAHFSVRHGTSGHKLLPSNENFGSSDNNESVNSFDDVRSECTVDTTTTSTNKSSPIVYSDPSLFRTANIQQISPACMDVRQNNIMPRKEFPNEDIERDFERLLRLHCNSSIPDRRNSNSNESIESHIQQKSLPPVSPSESTNVKLKKSLQNKQWRRKITTNTEKNQICNSIPSSDLTIFSNKRPRTAETYLVMNSPQHSPSKKSRSDMDMTEIDIRRQNEHKDSNNDEHNNINTKLLFKRGMEEKVLSIQQQHPLQQSNEQLHVPVIGMMDTSDIIQYGQLDKSYQYMNRSDCEDQWTSSSLSIPNTLYSYYCMMPHVGMSPQNIMTPNFYQPEPMVTPFTSTTSINQSPISSPQPLLDQNLSHSVQSMSNLPRQLQ